jgi:hypothetical protein
MREAYTGPTHLARLDPFGVVVSAAGAASDPSSGVTPSVTPIVQRFIDTYGRDVEI